MWVNKFSDISPAVRRLQAERLRPAPARLEGLYEFLQVKNIRIGTAEPLPA